MNDTLDSLAQELGTTEGTKDPPCVARQENGPTVLWNRKDPQYVRQQELPWHRLALELAAKGFTAQEIGERVGKTAVCVQDILRQPHYQQDQVDLIKRESDKDYEVVEVIKENVVEAVLTLADIIKDTSAKKSDRIAAAQALLDRRYGKPNQPMNRGTDVDLNNLSDKELAAMLPTQRTANT